MSSDVYYRIYLREDNLATVVCMQDFDECDYYEERFLTDDRGDRYKFDSEREAIEVMNNKVKTENIVSGQRNNRSVWEGKLK